MKRDGALDGARIAERLGDGVVLGRRVDIHEVVPSTNDLAAAQGAAGEEEGLVVVAESQEAGRGRRANSGPK